MKKNSILYIIMLVSLVSCGKSELEGSIDKPLETDAGDWIEVTLTACGDSSYSVGGENGVPTKVATSGLQRVWQEGDAIGVFDGKDNVNVKLTLVSGAGTGSGVFSGKMKAVKTPTTLYVYYPYSEGNMDPSRVELVESMAHQRYDGDYLRDGTFPSFGKYSMMVGRVSNFSVTEANGWESGKALTLSVMTGIVSFGLKAVNSDVILKSLKMMTPERGDMLTTFNYLNVTSGGYSYYYSDECDLTLYESGHKNVRIPKGETRYAQMSVMHSNFNGSDELRIIAEGIEDERNVRYTVSKYPASSSNFDSGKRRKVSVPLNNPEYSSRIRIMQNGLYVTTPVFGQESIDYDNGDTFWGDGTSELYHGGLKHKFADDGNHTICFNAWNSASITFENLENITSIDFRDL